MAISNYNTDPDLNVDISGINIAEGCPPSGINNAIRQMMADVKTFTDSPTFSGGMTVSSGATISGGISADTLTVSSGATISGGIVMQAGDGNEVTTTADNVTLTIAGGTDATDAPFLALVGKTKDANGGRFVLHSDNGANECNLAGFPDGTLTWDGNIKITSQSGARLSIYNTDLTKGTVPSSNKTIRIVYTDKNGDWFSDIGSVIASGTNKETRTYLTVHSNSSANQSYTVYVGCYQDGSHFFRPANDNGMMLGTAGLRWKQVYAGTATISTSDERLKTSISVVPDAVLDAWGEVSWQQFQMRDAVAEKGENARLHNGLIAQRIDEVFKAHGLDASRYGLFCWDSWEATPEERDEKGNVTQEARPAGDAYSLRYEEALCMEAAYQRRRADGAEARITALEQRLAELEQAIAALAGGAE